MAVLSVSDGELTRLEVLRDLDQKRLTSAAAGQLLGLEPQVRFVVPPGGLIVFSGAQLHSTIPNTTNVVRWSINFRTINIDDIVSKRGARNRDSASTGTSLRDFLRVADFAPIAKDIVAVYDNGVVPAGGVAVLKPETTGASAN